MKRVSMVEFGRTLTDRTYGQVVAQKIVESAKFPLVLDFKGVVSLGSSCGDEIASTVASRQDGALFVCNANGAVQSCLEAVAEDLALKLIVDDSPEPERRSRSRGPSRS